MVQDHKVNIPFPGTSSLRCFMTAEQPGPALDISPETPSSVSALCLCSSIPSEGKRQKHKTPMPLPLHQCQLCRETQPSWAQQRAAGEGGKASRGARGGGRWFELRSELLSCSKMLSISKCLWSESKMWPSGRARAT